MTWPAVSVNTLNLMQGESNEVERRYLFIGNAPKNQGKMIAVNAQTEFDDILGVSNTPFKRGLIAALTNAGQGWFASVAILGDKQDWGEIAEQAQAVGSFEAIVLTDPIDDAKAIHKAITLREQLIAKYGRWVRFILAVRGITPAETWADYIQFLAELQAGIASFGVTLVPVLFGNDPFVHAGRGCNRSVAIADTLARVQTGAVKALGTKPRDKEGAELSLATLNALEQLRYSVPMWYSALEGIYWADDRTLDVQSGDYQSGETVRVVDKVARRILLKGIAKIGDRSFNSSLISIKAHQSYFLGILREMATASQINGVTFPGEVKTPKDGDVTITWITPKQVQVYVMVRVGDVPLNININILVNNDLDQ